MPVESDSYEDDTTIPDDAELWRRIPPYHVVADKNSGAKRISSAAFEDHPDGTPMSVLLGKEVLADGRTARSVIGGYKGFFVASITAGLARTQNQGIARRPLPDEPAHAEVFGRKTHSVRKRLAREAVWIISPDEQ